MSKFNELVTKLREIFQIDRPELDFGVYRILNARADEINEYLEKRLKEKVEQALASGNSANVVQLKEELKKAEQGAQALGVDADTVPKVQELKTKISEATSGSADHENAVFSHLLTFFSRYYDQGDFISQRRYKGDTYAIPYAGEEVMLHWANKDQYYIKSGENFSNYSFKLEDGRVVHFRLVAADTAKDNRKDNDKERRFVLAEHQVITRIDDEGDEYEEEVFPVEEIIKSDAEGNETKELIIRFEYKSMPKGSKQEKLVESAVESVLADEKVASRWLDVGKRAPTEKKPKRTLLEKHLTNYTTKNTADYFIHKNLERFLRDELDFYIKNEVMHLDDVQNSEVFNNIEKNLRMIQCLRSIASDLIRFLAQLENFQKKLWTKKKFVVSAGYYLSVSLISEELYEEIVENPYQWAEWRALGFWSDKNNGTVDDLKILKGLLVNTLHYNATVRHKIISNISGLDESVDGVLIQSDNYHALNLLERKYENSIKFVYIDPPYNTNSTPIIYKNEYKHSSWASLMQDRLSKSMNLLSSDGVKTVAIDDSELTNLSIIMKQVAPDYTLSRVTVVHNPKGSITKNFNRVHEYSLFLTPPDGGVIARTLEENKTPRKMRRWGENSLRIERRLSFYPIYIRDGKVVDVGTIPEDSFNPESKNIQMSDGNIQIWPIDQDGVERRWNFGLESIRDNLDRITAIQKNGEWDLFLTHEKTVPKTVWSGGEFDAGKYGNTLLIDMLGEKIFDFPKSINLVQKCIGLTTSAKSKHIVLDYFAGSGTTAHAVINKNREDNGDRKFILVEQGEYFETVTKPRVIKASYAVNWEKGLPVDIENEVPKVIKVLRLESYEDTLNNIQLSRSQKQQDLLSADSDFKEDYQLNYMFQVDSRESLLSTEDFIKPFDYSMNITTDSAGAFQEQKIDLVETFNYLIGLTVKHIEAQPERGFVTVTGTLPTGDSCLVLWRDCERIDYEGLNKLCDKLAINPADNEFDVVYINGDHNIPTVLTQTAEEGGETRVLKLRQIEPEFLDRMFAEEDV
jgi:adenine-specific DNA-methyltransferase